MQLILSNKMDPVTDFFVNNIVVIYFFYGLAFFVMGLIIWLESNRTSEFRIARAFVLLAGFGIIHGLHEWFEMFELLSRSDAANIPTWLLIPEIRTAHLVISFLLLITFGVRLLFSTHRKDGREIRLAYLAAGGLLAVWAISALITRWLYKPSQEEFITALDVLSRYILGIPGALLAAWAIVLEQRTFRKEKMAGFGKDLQWAAWALILYGLVGQAFPPESFLFPANIINAPLFLETFGIPIQFFRATEAVLMAVFFIRALRAFEIERQRNLARAHEDRLAAQRQVLQTHRLAQVESDKLNQELREREELLAELLDKVVTAQEDERQRIARELHDGTGQILTGLGLGLAAASDSVETNPTVASRQLTELKIINAQALQELHNIIGDLRPSVLDDMGLVPALKGQVRQFEERTNVATSFEISGRRRRVQPELETIIFRIGQEALTNIAKHAKANSVRVHIGYYDDCLKLTVTDDGLGFEPETILRPGEEHRTAWGLLGMQERVGLAGGICFIMSDPGKGTTIHVSVPITKREKSE